MTIKSIKGAVARLLTAGLLAGAVVLAVPAKAGAQAVVFAGSPRFDRGFHYDRFRAREFRRREEWRHYRFDHRFSR